MKSFNKTIENVGNPKTCTSMQNRTNKDCRKNLSNWINLKAHTNI